MKCLLLDVKKGCRYVDVKSEDSCGRLDEYYNLIGCKCIDIVSRNINGKYYDIICDDEALLKENPMPSMIDENGKISLCGNLLICNCDDDGNEVSLLRDDLDRILEKEKMCVYIPTDEIIHIIEGEY